MTYAEAKKAATSRNADKVFTGDAGNGHTFEVYWCNWRKRQVWSTVNRAGYRII